MRVAYVYRYKSEVHIYERVQLDDMRDWGVALVTPVLEDEKPTTAHLWPDDQVTPLPVRDAVDDAEDVIYHTL